MNKQELAAKIWESANQMRSKIEANEYKDYILGFIFYKYLSVQLTNFALEQGMTEEDIEGLNEEDEATVDYFKQELGYFISYDDLFSTWLKPETEFTVANVRDALSAFGRLIHPNHKKLFDGIFNTLETGLSKLGESAQKQTKAINDLLHLIKNIPMDGQQGYDVLGFIYEYLIEKFAANAGKKAGEFYTPHEVSLLMSEITAHHLKGNETIEIYDPTSGSGSLLINIGTSVAKYIENKDSIKYYAQELKGNTYNLTRMNLIMRGILPNNIEVRNGDTLEEDWPYFDDNDPHGSYRHLRVDAVVSNPPYSQKWDSVNKETDPRYARFGLAPKTKADFAFLLHDLYHVKPDGIMSIVLPHGVLFRVGEEGEIRKQLIENNHIETIIGLPANIFFGTGIPTIILVLRQKRQGDDVLIVDASKHFIKEGKSNKLQASDIKRVVDTVINRDDRDKFSRLVKKSEIRENEYNLNIPRYVDSSEDAENWDLHATMLGGIPNSEIDQLKSYWSAFSDLRKTLFSPKNEAYSNLAVESSLVRQSITEHSDLVNFKKSYQETFTGFDESLENQLITNWQSINRDRHEATLAEELFDRLSSVELVDRYAAYQILNNYWQVISNDLEMMQTEGFEATKQVDANMVTKKKSGKDVTVQDGWAGHILPFTLVQETLLADDLEALRAQENRLAEISGCLEEILDSLSEEDKEGESIKESQDGFVNTIVAKEAKQFKAEAKKQGAFPEESYEAKIIQVADLIAEEKKVKKALKEAELALHSKTKDTIENLSDEGVNELLKLKWICPLVQEIDELSDSLISNLANQVQILADKYAVTYGEVESKIRETEQSLLGLMSELTGNEFDLEGMTELQKLFEGS
ncbi:putative type I restriction-modification system, methyltransferase subunit (N-6 DNA Methylase) [Lentisphaera araneosa HTCC2155]|uniref:site-specific DNA-methyltransferase (adenine-specific) n=1 Tax=Lentisphaera araneosa HTCC2155 TaxID=313628 RepID=A6DIK3_9BACT|nr:type I restriction-modification system subunit M [Lentisphaera araneosa]EDM28289.1 putative type I restriction-modification system, methyltransferase subunit (N-6 DNA Methylase) [Lentisphaera araneosa HTCC2155]